jgi:hypothetical protein
LVSMDPDSKNIIGDIISYEPLKKV